MNTKAKKVMTICFLIQIRDDVPMVCLARKKRGFLFGKLNGYGGKKEPEETVDACALRETWEESTVTPQVYERRGIVTYYDHAITHECHVYVITAWEGTPIETEEMAPSWYPVADIPFDQMNREDSLWVSSVLANQKVTANFYYDEAGSLLRSEVELVDKL